jgi:penicillin-binding protein 1C
MANHLQIGSGRSDDEVFNISYLTKEEDASAGVNDNFPLDPGTIWLVFEAMTEVTRPGAENAWRNYASSSKIAWKTGTSYGHRDAWAIGVNPDYAIGVWVGNADGEGRPGLTGLQVAAPILFDILNFVKKGRWFDPPEMYLDDVLVCSKSGFLKGPNCGQFERTQSTRSENTKGCPYCKIIHLDKEQKFQVSSDCEPIENIFTINWFVLPPAMEWFYLQNHSDYKPLPLYKSGCLDQENIPLALIYPQRNSQIFVPIELDGSQGRTIFRATHRNPGVKLFWHLDSEFLGETVNIHQISVAPAPGRHLLTVVDEKGNYLERKFTIIE